ncbi:MAG: class I SAM-dependent methyltransferase [Coriobacteriia bacterium]
MDTKHTVNNEYELLDSGDGRKCERFGDVVLSRPCGQAVWEKQEPETWAMSTASFDRELGWQMRGDAELPASWIVTINGIAVLLKPSPAGHLGVFPETRELWDWITCALRSPNGARMNVLNLFAYSGGATLAAARADCSVCHVDSSKSMVARARENAGLNQLDEAPIRWIVEDVGKFLNREIRRGRKYDAIMMDPPSFGHGTKGEQYRIDRDLVLTLGQCRALLTDEPAFVLLTSHTLGVTTVRLESLMTEVLGRGDIVSGEMELTGASGVRPVESGIWARWTPL